MEEGYENEERKCLKCGDKWMIGEGNGGKLKDNECLTVTKLT